MSNWVMGSERQSDGVRDVEMGITTDDSTGAMSGTIVFKGTTFHINGNWAASGSLPGRKYSAFGLWGSDQQDATIYISAVGTMIGPGAAPESILMNLSAASTFDDLQTAWDGILKPM